MTENNLQDKENKKTYESAPSGKELPPNRQGFGLKDSLQFFLCLLAVGGTLAFLMRPTKNDAQADVEVPVQSAPDVSASGRRTIYVRNDAALFQMLHLTEAVKKSIEAPLARVTGTVAAVKNDAQGESQWQFHTSELLTAYGDWRKSLADVAFAEEQLKATNQLSETKVKTISEKIDRKKKLVEIGTDTQQDLAELESERIEMEIENRKSVYEAETALRTAKNAATAAARQLEQEGIEPGLLDSNETNVAIVMANIPESLFDSVRIGQRCRLRFSGLPDMTLDGTIAAIVPFVSRELRSLRALFTVKTPHSLLRAGMFADVELGIDPRDVLLVPIEAVVHIGTDDFALARLDDEHWRVAEIQTGEPHENDVEILDGLTGGETVVGIGAILLKGAMIDSLSEALFPEQSADVPPADEREKTVTDEADEKTVKGEKAETESSEPKGGTP